MTTVVMLMDIKILPHVYFYVFLQYFELTPHSLPLPPSFHASLPLTLPSDTLYKQLIEKQEDILFMPSTREKLCFSFCPADRCQNLQ